MTDMRAATRNHDRVGNKAEMAFDSVAPDSGNTKQRTYLRFVDLCRMPLPIITQKSRPDILARSQKNGIGMTCSLVRQRSHMQSSQCDICTPGAIMVGQLISPVSRADIDLDHHQVRIIVQIQLLHMFILDGYLVIFMKIPGQRSQTERGKKGIFDWTKIGTDGFS